MKQYLNKTYLAGWEDHSIVLKITPYIENRASFTETVAKMAIDYE